MRQMRTYAVLYNKDDDSYNVIFRDDGDPLFYHFANMKDGDTAQQVADALNYQQYKH